MGKQTLIIFEENCTYDSFQALQIFTYMVF